MADNQQKITNIPNLHLILNKNIYDLKKHQNNLINNINAFNIRKRDYEKNLKEIQIHIQNQTESINKLEKEINKNDKVLQDIIKQTNPKIVEILGKRLTENPIPQLCFKFENLSFPQKQISQMLDDSYKLKLITPIQSCPSIKFNNLPPLIDTIFSILTHNCHVCTLNQNFYELCLMECGHRICTKCMNSICYHAESPQCPFCREYIYQYITLKNTAVNLFEFKCHQILHITSV